MRGATRRTVTMSRLLPCISIHAPHARSDVEVIRGKDTSYISIHAPHARSDDTLYAIQRGNESFQSTLLMRGATRRFHQLLVRAISISIHAPHARSDYLGMTRAFGLYNFNPRSSCEERLITFGGFFHGFVFQSTLLMRGATCFKMWLLPNAFYFNPRSSCEERRRTRSIRFELCKFQSTLLMRGAT